MWIDEQGTIASVRSARALLATVGIFTVAAMGCGDKPSGQGGDAASSVSTPVTAQATAQTEPPKVAGAFGKGSDVVIASYGGKTFTEADLRQELARLNKRSRKALSDAERRTQFVENHILSDLIFEEGRRQGLDQEDDVTRQVQDLERRLVIQKVMQDYQSAPVSDDEVREYYETHTGEFTSDRLKASHILVKEEQEAADIVALLDEDPTQFAALAEERSIDKSNAARGGDLGFFGRGRMVKEFEEAAFALEEDGQISEPVKTRFGYHIILRSEREDGKIKAFDDVKNQIRIRLINEKRKTRTQEFLDELKVTSNYKLDTDLLVSIDVSDIEDEGDDPPARIHGSGSGH